MLTTSDSSSSKFSFSALTKHKAKLTLWLWFGSSVFAFLLMVTSFWLYVNAEHDVEKTADQRLSAVLVAEKMRHTSESLTKMVRHYVLTGNPEYKQWYNELDDIRQGRVSEPPNQYIWDLRLYGESPLSISPSSSAPLHVYVEGIAQEDEYGRFLRSAWTHIGALTILEREAFALYDVGTQEARLQAKELVFSPRYSQAKLDVLRPLMAFLGATTERNVQATNEARRWATMTRTSFVMLGLLSLFLFWKTYNSMRSIHGASVKDLQEPILRLGQGDFASMVLDPHAREVDPNSLMAWLNQSRARLQELDAARQNAEYELSDKNRHLAINNMVLQELTVGLPLGGLLDKLILTIEKNHPGMLCSVLLTDKDGLSLRHAAAPSMGESWAKATENVRIGAGVGSCGSAACRKERVLVEDVQVHPFWADFQDAASEAGIRSAWSQPILDSHDAIIGTFAIYQRFPALPTEQEIRWLESFAKLAGYVIERSRLADALNQTKYLYDLITKNVNDLIWVQDLPKMKLRYLSPSSTKVLGWAPEEFFVDRDLAFSKPVQAQLVERFMDIYNRTKAGDLSAMEMTFESELQTKHRGVIPVELSVKANLNENGEPTTLIGVARDISERRKTEEIIRNMAFYDALTGLPNRRMLEDRLHQVLVTAKHMRTKVSVLFIDLDRFKAVNDLHGHKMGDWLLVDVAKRMKSVLRDSDMAARVGGDEFVVVLPNSATIDAAVHVAQNIRHVLEKPFITDDGIVLDISSSIGVAMYPDQADNPRDLLHFGDEAMYKAKKDGRNAVVAFDSNWSSVNQTTV